MKKILCILCISVGFLQAQIINYDKLVLKFTPTSLLTPQTAAIQLGAEYRPKLGFGIATDVASNFGRLKYADPCIFCSGQSSDARNFKWRTEARWYFTPERKNSFYWAEEVFVVLNNYTNQNSIGRRDSIYYNLPLSHVRTVGIGMATKVGFNFRIGGRWRGDTFFGVGIRRSERTTDIVSEKRIGSAFDPMFLSVFNIKSPIEINYLPHVSIGARIGYVLWKSNK